MVILTVLNHGNYNKFNVKEYNVFYSLWMSNNTINVPESSMCVLIFCSVKGEFDIWTECLAKMFYSGTAKYFVDGFVRKAYRGT
jgi:hypothetical protein